MKTWKTTLGLFIALMAIFAVGCNDTAQGMAEDTAENTEAAAQAADDAAEAVEEGAEDAAATALTGRIKTALVANPITNEDGILINVESGADMVRLEGHVHTQEQKDEAGKLAEAVLKEAEATQKLENNLEVVPAENH